MAFCIPAVGESYDCAKAAISLERSNSFPWPKDCVQIHQMQTLFPRRGWGLGTRLAVHVVHGIYGLMLPLTGQDFAKIGSSEWSCRTSSLSMALPWFCYSPMVCLCSCMSWQ